MFRIFCCVIASAVLGSLAQAKPPPSQSYPHYTVLDEDLKYNLYWDFDDVTITFEVIVETTGYVALGWSAKGGMKDADIITAWVDDQGKGHIQDRYGVGFMQPQVDASHDVFLQMAQEIDGYTIIKFSRKLDTCDKKHDREITDSTMRLIWAHGASDPWHEGALYYHSTNRGTKSIHLTGIQPLGLGKPMPDDAKTHDFLQTNFNVPPQDTHYQCMLMPVPKLDTKHHVVKYEPIVTPGNEAMVHHMIGYICNIAMNKRNVSDMVGVQRETCFDEFHNDCLNPAFTWAIGGSAFPFPDHIGYPIGGAEEPMYVLLEIHYDNPQLRSDILDSSGIRITYSPTLRDYDLGVLEVVKGGNEMFTIPPQSEAFRLTGECTGACTMEAFDKVSLNEIKVIATFPHTHLAGRAVRLRHIRNGVELPYLVNDESYDFNYQTAALKENEVEIRRGDDMLVECTYETMDRDKPTVGGLGTRDEMCITFIYHYPRLTMNICGSQVTQSGIRDMYSKVNNLPNDYDWAKFDANATHYWNSIAWDKDAAEDWQHIDETSNLDTYCLYTGQDPSVTFVPDQPRVSVNKPYVPPPSTCDIHTPSTAANTAYSLMLMMSSVIVAFVTVLGSH